MGLLVINIGKYRKFVIKSPCPEEAFLFSNISDDSSSGFLGILQRCYDSRKNKAELSEGFKERGKRALLKTCIMLPEEEKNTLSQK